MPATPKSSEAVVFDFLLINGEILDLILGFLNLLITQFYPSFFKSRPPLTKWLDIHEAGSDQIKRVNRKGVIR